MGLRSQIGWLRHGATRTQAALAAYQNELAELQLKVEALTQVVARLDVELAGAGQARVAHVEGLVEAMKEQLRVITDDLGDRIGAVAERLDASQTT